MPKFEKPRLLSRKELNTLAGKTLAGHITREEMMQVFGHLDCLEMRLDETGAIDDWRYFLGIPCEEE